MNKYFSLFTFMMLFLFSNIVIAADKYVTDNLSVFLRSGPSTNYGVVGTLKAGDKVNVLDVSSDGKFVRITDSQNRTAWLQTALLVDNPIIKASTAELEKELNQVKAQLATADQDKQAALEDYRQQLSQAKQQISKLNSAQSEYQQNAEYMASDKVQQDMMYTWFIRGGLVAAAGLILGLILPAIIPRHRRKDRWMN